MTIISQLKRLNAIGGTLREITNVIPSPRKLLREIVHIGLPQWDPPEEAPPSPPDHETVARAQEVIAMGTREERRVFDKLMKTWRDIKDGQPRQPAKIPSREGKAPSSPSPETTREGSS